MPHPRKPARLGEAAFGLGVILFGVLVAILAARIPAGPAYARVGPRLFPWLVAGALVLVGIAVLVEAWRSQPPESRTLIDWRAIGLVGVGLAGQIALMTWGGFIVASTVLFVAVAAAFGSRRFIRDTLVGLALCAVTQIVFTWGLGLRLPSGIFAGLL